MNGKQHWSLAGSLIWFWKIHASGPSWRAVYLNQLMQKKKKRDGHNGCLSALSSFNSDHQFSLTVPSGVVGQRRTIYSVQLLFRYRFPWTKLCSQRMWALKVKAEKQLMTHRQYILCCAECICSVIHRRRQYTAVSFNFSAKLLLLRTTFPIKSGLLARRLTLAIRAGSSSCGVQRPCLHPTRSLWSMNYSFLFRSVLEVNAFPPQKTWEMY